MNTPIARVARAANTPTAAPTADPTATADDFEYEDGAPSTDTEGVDVDVDVEKVVAFSVTNAVIELGGISVVSRSVVYIT